jgi:hypothetical protein
MSDERKPPMPFVMMNYSDIQKHVEGVMAKQPPPGIKKISTLISEDLPTDNYFVSMLRGMYHAYIHAAGRARMRGDTQMAIVMQAKADTIEDCLTHYQELDLDLRPHVRG